MADDYSSAQSGLDSPARKGVEITPDDNNDLAYVSRAVWVGGVGNLEVTLEGDSSSITIQAIPAGTWLPIRAKRIYSTGTTATLIVALR